MPIDDPSSLIRNEGIDFEAKRCLDRLPREFWPTYSAFANTFGGRIVLGLTEDPDDLGKLLPAGVKNPDKVVEDLWAQANNTQKVSTNILSDSDVRTVEFEGVHLIVVDVPRAERRRRPVYIDNNMNNGTYRRNGEGDYHCTISEISEMIRDSRDIPADSAVCCRARMSDLCEDSISRYRVMLKAHRPSHPWNSEEDDEFLRLLGAADMDEQGELRPTVAGALMFSRDYIITKELPRYSLDYLRTSGLGEEWTDRLTTDSGDWTGNLFDFAMGVFERLSTLTEKPFVLNGVVRVDESDLMKSMREAVLNGLIHADYDGIGGVRMEVDGSRLVVRNPGTFRIPIQKAVCGGVSDPRNPNVMKMFTLVGLAEKAGSGLYRMVRTCEHMGLPKPSIVEDMDPATVTTTITLTRGRADAPDADAVLEHLRENPDASLASVSASLGLSTSTVSRRIRKLRDEGRLERSGSRKTGTWVVRDRARFEPGGPRPPSSPSL